MTATSSSCAPTSPTPRARRPRSTRPSSASVRVDILVNNAAIYGDYNGGDNSLEYLKQVFDVNLHGQWVMARAVAPLMVGQRWGRIVNVASIAAYLHQLSAMADPDNFELSNYAYMQSKWGVLGLTRHMAGQLGQFNVTVNCIAPGLVNTEATEKQVPTDFQPMFATMSAMRQNAEPEHMVGVAVFFASSDADLVNGQVLVVDGGNVMPVMRLMARRRGDPHAARAHRAARRHRRPRRVPHAASPTTRSG